METLTRTRQMRAPWAVLLAHWLQRAFERALSGGGWTCAAYLLLTGAVGAVVLATVNAHGEEALARAEMTSRTMAWLQNWYHHGFFRYAGLLIYSSDGTSVYTTHSGFNAWPAYALQVFVRAATGGFSHHAMAMLNQSFVWLGAALLGWWVMRIVPLAARHEAFLLGLGCAVVYQTFPLNLLNYWFLNPTVLGIDAMLTFWIAQDAARREPSRRLYRWIAAGSMLVLALACSTAVTVFFIGSYAAARFLLRDGITWRELASVAVVPALAAFAFHWGQVQWVEATIPGMQAVGGSSGSDLLFRTGLDGSSEFYTDHWALLTRREMSTSYPGRRHELLLTWKWLLIGGTVAALALAVSYARTAAREWRPAVVFLSASFGCYLLMAFTFSQGVVIHPDIFDVLLVLPVIVALLALAPAYLEAVTSGTGMFVLIGVVAALCYTMVQLRTYAVAVPVL